MRAARVLVIGYGNPGRWDDGLGPALAAELGGLGLPNVTTSSTVLAYTARMYFSWRRRSA